MSSDHIATLRQIRWEMEGSTDAELVSRRATMDAAIAALEAQQQAGVPEGWVLVPREPTPGMLDAGFVADRDADTHKGHARWGAMLAAAPKPDAWSRIHEAPEYAAALAEVDAQIAGKPESTEASAPVGVEKAARRLLAAYDDDAHPFEAAGAAEELRMALAQQPAAGVCVDFPQVGTAGPLAVVDGKVTLPDATMNDLIRHARTGYVEQPAPVAPDRIVLWSRGVEPNWYFVAQKSDRQPIDGMAVYETLDEIVRRGSLEAQQPAAVDEAMVGRFCRRWYEITGRSLERVHVLASLDSALAGQQGGPQE